MRNPAPILFLLALCAGALTGCNSRATSAGLKPEVAAIERSGEATMVTWRLMNPNVVPYLLATITNRIYLNGILVGTTGEKQPVAIPAGTQIERVTPLTIAGPAAERALADVAPGSSANYRVETQIIIQIYGDTQEKGSLENSGTLKVTKK